MSLKMQSVIDEIITCCHDNPYNILSLSDIANSYCPKDSYYATTNGANVYDKFDQVIYSKAVLVPLTNIPIQILYFYNWSTIGTTQYSMFFSKPFPGTKFCLAIEKLTTKPIKIPDPDHKVIANFLDKLSKKQPVFYIHTDNIFKESNQTMKVV